MEFIQVFVDKEVRQLLNCDDAIIADAFVTPLPSLPPLDCKV